MSLNSTPSSRARHMSLDRGSALAINGFNDTLSTLSNDGPIVMTTGGSFSDNIEVYAVCRHGAFILPGIRPPTAREYQESMLVTY